MKIIFIGGGNMGEAFINSLLKNNIYKTTNITVIEKSQTRLNYLQKKYNIHTSTDINLIKNAETIFLAIKPQNLKDLPNFNFDKSPIVISILAGTKISKISEKFTNTKIVQTMPNLGQFVGQGITGMYFDKTSNFTQNQIELVKKIFTAGGKIVEVENEDKLDGITAISGSGPAYFFYFLEVFTKITQSMGFTEEQAKLLSQQTFFGASEIIKENPNDSAKDWRKRVTSKGGTTEEAFKVFKKSDFENIFYKAINSAKIKAEELGK